jgi:hypothetical protein
MPSVTEREAMQMFAATIGEIVGKRSEAYRDMVRALESEQVVDMMLAQSSFDGLPPETRHEIAARVEELVAEKAAVEEA